MDKEGVVDLANLLIDENQGALKDTSSYLSHLKDSYDIAGEAAERAVSNYSLILKEKLIPEEVALAAGLHDIGRPMQADQLFHELRGVRLVEQRGLEFGIADNIIDVYRIAQMFSSHGFVYEQFNAEENDERRKEFEPLDSMLLIPRTWQEIIVACSELKNVRGRRIGMEERLNDALERYARGSEYAKTNPSLAQAIRDGSKRILETNKILEKLILGELREEEFMRYGFI